MPSPARPVQAYLRAGLPWSLFALRVPDAIPWDAIEQAFVEMQRRHEVLRTEFTLYDEGATQRLLSAGPPVRRWDLSGVDVDAAGAIGHLSRQPRAGFQPTPYFFALLRTKQGGAVLIGADHAVFDGWSITVALRELVGLAHTYHAGDPSPRGELPIQAWEYHQWLALRERAAVAAGDLAFWRALMGRAARDLGAPMLGEAVRSAVPAVTTYAYAPVEQWQRWAALASTAGARLHDVALTALALVVSREFHVEEVRLLVHDAMRGHVHAQDLLGYHSRDFPLHVRPQTGATFLEAVRDVARCLAECRSKAPALPSDTRRALLRELGVDAPYPLSWNWHAAPDHADAALPEGFAVLPAPVTQITGKDLEIQVRSGARMGMILSAVHPVHRLPVEAAKDLLRKILGLIEDGLSRPDRPVARG